jgi:LysM repeat protein
MPIKRVTEVVRDRRRIIWAVAALISFIALARCASAQTPVLTSDSTTEVTHVVKTGDTLWDIARTYLKNPFRWPDIFRRNTDIVKNPHWIYPGEVIRIPLSELNPAALSRLPDGNVVARVNTSVRPPTVFSTGLGSRSTSGTMTAAAISRASSGRVVRAGEMEAAPYVDRNGGPLLSGKIRAAVDRPAIQTPESFQRFQLNDRLYVSLPRGMTERLGDRYLAYVLGKEMGRNGQLVIPTALLQIESIRAGEPAVARIIRQFGEVRLEQRLVPAEAVTGITRMPEPTGDGVTGKIIHVYGDPILPSVQHYVVLSPTSANGVAVGDEFTLIDNTMGRDDPTPAPPVPAAVAQVVKVTAYATTAIIIGQIQPAIKAGMPVRLTARMP